MSNPQQTAHIVYLAGVHVPTGNVTVTMSFRSFPVLTVSMPATSDLIKLGEEDKLPVAVFFLDKWYSSSSSRKKVTPTWRLLFDGDIVSWRFSKGVAQRTISFTAVSHMSTLNAMRIMYLTGKGNEVVSSLSTSSLTNVATLIPKDVETLSFFKKGLYGTGAISRPIDFVKNLLLGVKIGGPPHEKGTAASRVSALKAIDSTLKNKSSTNVSGKEFVSLRQPANKKVSAVMEFFIKYNHRNRLDKRWIASSIEELGLASGDTQNTDSDKPRSMYVKDSKGSTTKELPNTVFVSSIRSITRQAIMSNFQSNIAKNDSFWNMINMFYTSTWYNILLISTPQFVTVNEDEDIPLESGNTDAAHARLGNCISVPQMSYALPPACNVITPAMVTSYTYGEDYSIQNTRTIVNGYNAFSLPGSNTAHGRAIQTQALRYGYPTDQAKMLEESVTLKKNPEGILVYPEEYFKGPVISRPQIPEYFVALETNSRYVHNAVKDEKGEVSKNSINGTQGVPPDDHHKAAKVSGKEWRHELSYAFAKSYFLESKYHARNGQMSLNFNPYLIPGLPFVMLDSNDDDQLHLTGVITAVNISMTGRSVSTAVSYSAGRTLKEVYEHVFTENTFGPEGGLVDLDTTNDKFDIYTTAPIMPIKVLADKLQTDSNAEDFYRSLLYTNSGKGSERASVYRYSTYFKSTSGKVLANTVPSSTSSDLINKLQGTNGTKTFPGSISKVTVDPSGKYFGHVELDLQVKESMKESISDYEDSMQRASRPICTLDEYMQMFNTKEHYSTLKNGVTDDEFGVPYPLTIRHYYVSDALDSGFIRPSHLDPTTDGANAPELRRNWPKRLKVYRNKIKNRHVMRR